MHATRELMVGGGTFAAIVAGAMAFAAITTSSTLRGFMLILGIGAGGGCAVLAALMAHLTRGPAQYEPIAGEGGAWGMDEYEERGRPP